MRAWWIIALATGVIPARLLGQNSEAPTTQSVYSLYVTRHDATVEFAQLGKSKAADGRIRKLADQLITENKTTAEKVRKLAEKDKVVLTRVDHDTTEVLLANARQLESKSGAAWDTAYALQTYDWLQALMMDNGKRVLRAVPDGDLKKFAEAYNGFLFRELVEASRVRDKYRKK